MRLVPIFFTLLLTLTPIFGHAEILSLPSHQAALAWAEKWEARNARDSGAAPRQVFPETDPRYAQIKRSLEKIWSGFRKAYPKETEGLEQAPFPVLISDDNVVNAYAVYDAVSGELPFLFVIHTSALKASEAEQLGLYAHELAHLVFRHNVPGNAEAMRKFYSVAKGAAEPLGFEQNNDPKLQRDMGKYLKLVGDVGPVADESLAGLIMDPTGESNYAPLQKFLLRRYVDLNQDPQACAKVGPAYQQFMALAAAQIDPASPKLKLAEKERKALARLAKEILISFRACAKGENPGLVQLFSDSSGLSKEKVEELVPASDIKLFDSLPNAADGFLAITKPRQKDMLAIAKAHDLHQVRIYSEEEQADEAGARVLLALELPVNGLSDFLLNWLGGEEYRKACLAEIGAGKIPSYGPLTDLHHDTCYRVYHLGRFEEALRK